MKSSDYTSAAIKINGITPNVDIAYNTAVVAGHENNVACYLNDAMEAMTVRNNIFLARDNGLVYRTYKDADAAAITFSNNVLHNQRNCVCADKQQYETRIVQRLDAESERAEQLQ